MRLQFGSMHAIGLGFSVLVYFVYVQVNGTLFMKVMELDFLYVLKKHQELQVDHLI